MIKKDEKYFIMFTILLITTILLVITIM